MSAKMRKSENKDSTKCGRANNRVLIRYASALKVAERCFELARACKEKDICRQFEELGEDYLQEARNLMRTANLSSGGIELRRTNGRAIAPAQH